MTSRIGVLVIHGMGSQGKGFSAEFTEEVAGRLDDNAARVRWQEIHWARVIKSREDDLWDQMQLAREPDGSPIDLDWKRTRRFIVHNFGDAIAYQRDYTKTKSAYNLVHTIISDAVKALKISLADTAAPIVVAAHSLGAHMMSNYIWDRQHTPANADTLERVDALTAMITFGCNIPLFSLAFPVARPINLPGKSIKKAALVEASKWLNFLDRDDVLGWPLKPLYERDRAELNQKQTATLDRIEDYEINVGSLFSSWNPVAHGGYWTDNDFTKPVAKYLEKLIEAVDAPE